MNKTIRFNIGNMTCVNCQNKSENGLNHTEGVISASVSYNDATTDIVYDGERISLKEIITAIEDLDYEMILGTKTAGPNITNVVCMLVIIVSLYIMLQTLGILNLPALAYNMGRVYALRPAAIHVDRGSGFRQSVCRGAFHVSIQSGHCAADAGPRLRYGVHVPHRRKCDRVYSVCQSIYNSYHPAWEIGGIRWPTYSRQEKL